MAGIEPLSWRSVATAWAMPFPIAVFVVVAALAYLVAARRVPDWRRRDTTWFLLGLAIIAVAAGGSVNVYSRVLFTAQEHRRRRGSPPRLQRGARPHGG
ncbi:cytochrome c oxidase assembly protein [Amycolatopsis taiwanensis]|uniref:cytochrome c oxidase assembly protein n=1 Tax=Amycolatopsis taiwanensis TaxID=342230 RepID=UPI00255581F0|nr:cytochrome c oxidase assembly protein [Amycolatopsis taiwanensis]